MNARWSPSQRRCLDALGYSLYRTASAAMSTEATEIPVTQVIEHVAATMPVKNPGNPGAGERRIPASAIDPLVQALFRAAAIDPQQCDDIVGWLSALQVPSLTQLRNNPAAKRALWPRLRAMRRGRSDSNRSHPAPSNR